MSLAHDHNLATRAYPSTHKANCTRPSSRPSSEPTRSLLGLEPTHLHIKYYQHIYTTICTPPGQDCTKPAPGSFIPRRTGPPNTSKKFSRPPIPPDSRSDVIHRASSCDGCGRERFGHHRRTLNLVHCARAQSSSARHLHAPGRARVKGEARGRDEREERSREARASAQTSPCCVCITEACPCVVDICPLCVTIAD